MGVEYVVMIKLFVQAKDKPIREENVGQKVK